MDLSPINGCIVATTFVDLVGDLAHQSERHRRVTRQSIKRIVQGAVADLPTGAASIRVAGVSTRSDDFLGIEIAHADGSLAELGVLELQQSLIGELRRLGGGFPGPVGRALEGQRRPMTTTSHGAIVDQIEAPTGTSEVAEHCFVAGFEGLKRALKIPDTAQKLGVQWAKSQMLEIRADANPAYVQLSVS